MLRKAFMPLNLSFGSAFHRTLEWMSSLGKSGNAFTADVDGLHYASQCPFGRTFFRLPGRPGKPY